MGFIAKLKHGSREIDLTSDPYRVASGWAPPAPLPISLMSSGNMSNSYAGGKRIDRQFVDRPLSLPLNIKGASASETHQSISALVSFLENSVNDTSEKLYFVYNASDAVSYEPKWGQHHRYYEIKDADIAIVRASVYGTANINSQFIAITLPFIVAPLATGLRQRVGSATGGIIEHTWGTPNKLSRGTIIPPARTNHFANPIFGHGTYDNGWTTSMLCAENTDKAFVFAGTSSAKLTRTDANTTMTESVDLTAATHLISCYAKKPDGSAITNSEAVIYYNSASQTTNVLAVGDGWYLLWASVTGTGAATTTGMRILAVGISLYVDGFQAEQTSLHVSPLVYGDLLDCAWSGTAHEDTSVRTVSRWKIDSTDMLEIAAGSMTFSLRMGTPYDTGADFTICADGNAAMLIFYDEGSDKWQFYDGTTTIGSGGAADDFEIGDLRTITATWGAAGIALYKNGVLLDSNATYTPPTLHADFYIGSRAAPSQHHSSTYLDAVAWAHTLTAAEVLAHYTNVTEHVSGGDGFGQRLNTLLWRWTGDGDDIIDQYTDATHENYCVYGGIPGNVPARTYHHFDTIEAGLSLFVSNFQSGDYIDLSECFADLSGHVDAGAVGGEVEQETVTTSASVPQSNLSTFSDGNAKKIISGIPFRIFASISDAGSGLSIAAQVGVSFSSVVSDYKTIVADGTRKDFLTKDAIVQISPSNDYPWVFNTSKVFSIYIKRATGSDVAEIDYTQLFLGDFFYIEDVDANTDEIIVDGKIAVELISHSANKNNKTIGDVIDLYPNLLNHMCVMSGTLGTDTLNTRTVLIHLTYVEPRWSLT